MTKPSKNLRSCRLCGQRNPSHAIVTLDGVNHGRVCASHTLRDVILHVDKNFWRIRVSLEFFKDGK